jgi:NTP pyrophosphatase (non-canonical NTP hydrolase)
MTFKEYQNHTATTAVYPKEQGITYCTLKLTSEAGEVADAIGKWIRNHEITDVNDLKRVQHRDDVNTALGKIAGEIGDVLWYCSQLAAELDLDLDQIARANLLKLQQRKEDGELKERKTVRQIMKNDNPNYCIRCHTDLTGKVFYGAGDGTGKKFVCEDCYNIIYNRFCTICNRPIFNHDTVVTIQKGDYTYRQYHIECWVKNSKPQV